MKLTDLVKDPSKLQTYGKYISADERLKRILQGDENPRLVSIVRQNPYSAYQYATFVLGGKRWPEGEKRILTDPDAATQYATEVLQKRWPEREPIIATDRHAAYNYARDVIKGRWPKGEARIATDGYNAYLYARYVIKGRWPKGEARIAKEPMLVANYALQVTLNRFPEGEPVLKDSGWEDLYNLQYGTNI